MSASNNSTNNNNGNFTVEFPTLFPLATVGIFFTLYSLVLLIGILGNVLTCGVILLRKSMRRSIHFYTFNLATCDLLILIFYVPNQLAYINEQMNWKMGLAMCKISYFILPIALVSTIGTLLAITIDRARGLLQPFRWRSDSTRSAKIAIPIIWFFSIILNIPMFIVPQVTHYEIFTTCSEVWPNTEIETYYWFGMFIVVFAIPLAIIFILHVVMVAIIRKEENVVHRRHNKKMMHLTVAVVIVFTVSTGFQHVYFFLTVYGKILLKIKETALLYCISNFVVSLQASLNPIIYGTLRHDFQKAFKSILVKLMDKLKLHNFFCFSSGGAMTTATSVNSLSIYMPRLDCHNEPANHTNLSIVNFGNTSPCTEYERAYSKVRFLDVENDQCDDELDFNGNPSKVDHRLSSFSGKDSLNFGFNFETTSETPNYEIIKDMKETIL